MKSGLRIAIGILCALFLFNFCVGIFVTPQRWVYPPLPISQDGPRNAFRAYGQFFEGISTASINDSGARFTAEFTQGAPLVAIVGDSHVLARNVNDGEVMGAVAARLAREAGKPLNVRELGRSAASAVEISAAAPEILNRWQPSRVFVVLSAHTFDQAFLDNYRQHIREDGTVRPPPARPDTPLRRAYWRFRDSSPLAELFCGNPVGLFGMLWRGGAPDPESPTPTPTAADPTPQLALAVNALQKAFGPRLVVVFHPVLSVTGGTSPEAGEIPLEALCRARGIPFINVRQAMVEERDQHHRISNGFVNRVPGTGHLNANGHRIIGTAIWQFLHAEGIS